MDAAHLLGRFGESFVRENPRASGFEVYDANLNGRGIDLIAVKRDAQGTLTEARPVEVKTRSQGTDFRLDSTQEGRQLSSDWTSRRLARLAEQHPDPRLRQVAAEVLKLKEVHPEQIRPQLWGLAKSHAGW
jgi:Holliday junction resolvase-like predicted endonuclease